MPPDWVALGTQTGAKWQQIGCHLPAQTDERSYAQNKLQRRLKHTTKVYCYYIYSSIM
ncbi:MAG: hypothetical protein ACOYJG_01210 [Prevotella sp.]